MGQRNGAVLLARPEFHCQVARLNRHLPCQLTAADEAEWLDLFRQLDRDKRQLILQLTRSLRTQ